MSPATPSVTTSPGVVQRHVQCERGVVSDWWAAYQGDTVEIARQLPSNSIDYCLHSPPFSSLYCYSDSSHDMGNSEDDERFFQHYAFLIREALRIMRPGRLVSVHCKQLVDYKGRDGRSGLRDFRGECIRAWEAGGFKLHAEVCIWKCPVTEMQRTKSHGLLYKQLRADSSFSRQGLAEYILTFRKWAAEGEEVRPVTHTETDFTLDEWQRIASPVWMDIDQTNVLNGRIAREDQDEKHICPLQLDVVERCVRLWSNPGDVVWSPFMGVGSEGYGALLVKDATGKRQPRRFIGADLKRTYFDRAVEFLREADPDNKTGQKSLFELFEGTTS